MVGRNHGVAVKRPRRKNQTGQNKRKVNSRKRVVKVPFKRRTFLDSEEDKLDKVLDEYNERKWNVTFINKLQLRSKTKSIAENYWRSWPLLLSCKSILTLSRQRSPRRENKCHSYCYWRWWFRHYNKQCFEMFLCSVSSLVRLLVHYRIN